MRRFVSFVPAVLVMVTLAAMLLVVPAVVRHMASAQTKARIVLAQQALDDEDILERLNRATRAVAETARASVVHLEVTPGGERAWRSRSSGSGWVWSEDGYIVTNAHVVRGAERISVQFADGRVVEPEPIRGEPFLADPFTDIAVLRVPTGGNLAPFRRATGLVPVVGDRVYAFGSPFGFRFSMSEGIIGGVGRDPQTASDFGGYTNYLQHDAAVNPGNSGGPLVDIRARVVGMNVAIATGRDSQGTTGEGQSAGISFAIPLATIESVVEQLIERGEVARGYLGIRWMGRQESIVYEPTIRRTGIRIQDVEREGPADDAGLKANDIITEIAGVPVTNFAVMRSVITSSRPGSTIPVRAWREGQEIEVKVTLAALPTRALLGEDGRGPVWNELARYGVLLTDGEGGPVVRRVMPESRAAEAGFTSGARVLAVGERDVRSRQEVQEAALEAGLLVGRRVVFRISDVSEEGESEPRDIVVQMVR